MHEVKKYFKPEFLNRLDDIVVFHYLEKDHVRQISRMFVQELGQRLLARNIHLQVDDEVFDKLARDGFDPVYGARPLRREVERQVENPLAMKMVRNEIPDRSRVHIVLKDDNVTFVVEEVDSAAGSRNVENP